jgi:hypothetical protein
MGSRHKNWLFTGSLRSGIKAAAMKSLIQSARPNGHDPFGYLKDVLLRLPTHQANEIDQLLPHDARTHTAGGQTSFFKKTRQTA